MKRNSLEKIENLQRAANVDYENPRYNKRSAYSVVTKVHFGGACLFNEYFCVVAVVNYQGNI